MNYNSTSIIFFFLLEIFISYISPDLNSHAISKHDRREKLTVNTTSTNGDNHGAGWDKVEGSGPELPTEQCFSS